VGPRAVLDAVVKRKIPRYFMSISTFLEIIFTDLFAMFVGRHEKKHGREQQLIHGHSSVMFQPVL
jgi:hypothetical protein